MLWESDLLTQMGTELSGAGLLSGAGRKVLRQDWEGKDPSLPGKWWKVAFYASNLLAMSCILIVAAEIWLQRITDCSRDTLWWSHICWVEEKSPAPCFLGERCGLQEQASGLQAEGPMKGRSHRNILQCKPTKTYPALTVRHGAKLQYKTCTEPQIGRSENELSLFWKCWDILEISSHDGDWVCFSLFPSPHHAQGDLSVSQSTTSLGWVVSLKAGRGWEK